MIDARMRAVLSPSMGAAAARLDRLGIRPGTVTAAGLLVGIGCCVAAALGEWTPALVLWLGNRLFDGLDGPLARLRGATDLGGMLDFLADFVVYGGFAVAVAVPDARLGRERPARRLPAQQRRLLSFSSILERRGIELGDERSLRFTAGLTEGAETIVCYALVCLAPAHAATIFWVFAALVLITVGQRLALAVSTLGRRHDGASGDGRRR